MRATLVVGVVIGVAVLSAGCDGRGASETELPLSIEGIWWLDWIEVDGVEWPIEIGVNALEQPSVAVTDRLSGSLGCNDFATQPFTFEDGLLIPGEFMQTAMLCTGLDGTDAMSIERIIKGLFSRSPGIQVELLVDVVSGDDEMIWTNGATRLSFVRAAAEPTPAASPPPNPFGSSVPQLPTVMHAASDKSTISVNMTLSASPAHPYVS